MTPQQLAHHLVALERQILGRGFTFYQTDGRILFELRGASGGLTSSMVCYIIPNIQPRKTLARWVIEFKLGELEGLNVTWLLEQELIKFVGALNDQKFPVFDTDGGDMGLGNPCHAVWCPKHVFYLSYISERLMGGIGDLGRGECQCGPA